MNKLTGVIIISLALVLMTFIFYKADEVVSINTETILLTTSDEKPKTVAKSKHDWQLIYITYVYENTKPPVTITRNVETNKLRKFKGILAAPGDSLYVNWEAGF